MAIDESKGWLEARLGTKKVLNVLLFEYWIPKNINFLWAFGAVLAFMFIILVITGLFLTMYYKPDANLAFDSVNYTIMQEVEYGWIFRNVHAVGASFTFLILYIHMFTGIYYGSFKRGREIIWVSGMLLLILFSAEAFSGYMLPWGQMSYWAATVITNLFSAIPVIGDDLVMWIRGDYVVSDPTLTRFFMLHVVLLPLAIMGVMVLHFYSLRIPHVNNQDSEEIDFDAEAEKYKKGHKQSSKVLSFFPDFISKDMFITGCCLIVFFFLVFYNNSFALDPINFNPADPLKTPPHIYPEWYFLWSYEVLRGFFFSSDLGLIAFAIANVIFMFMPWLDRNDIILPAHERPIFKWWFWIMIVDLIVLSIYGKLPPTGANAYIGFVASIVFLGLFFLLPILSYIERKNMKSRL